MAEDYTPTTETVREVYAVWRYDEGVLGERDAADEFTRWLAAHDRQVAERAAAQALVGASEDPCATCGKPRREHRSGYSAYRCTFRAAAAPDEREALADLRGAVHTAVGEAIREHGEPVRVMTGYDESEVLYSVSPERVADQVADAVDGEVQSLAALAARPAPLVSGAPIKVEWGVILDDAGSTAVYDVLDQAIASATYADGTCPIVRIETWPHLPGDGYYETFGRTVADAPAAEPEYPKPCSNCGALYSTCTERIRSGRRACCGTCGYTATHDQNAWEAWDRQRTHAPAAEPEPTPERVCAGCSHPEGMHACTFTAIRCAMCGCSFFQPTRTEAYLRDIAARIAPAADDEAR
jgi:hypothetical protein